MVWQLGWKGKKNANTSSRFNGVVDVQRKSILERNSEAETITQLKILALDPCRPQLAHDDIQILCNQILRIRKVMDLKDSETPWKKRKLEQFVKAKQRPPNPSFVYPNKQEKTKLSKKSKSSSHFSSVSCLLNSAESSQSYGEKNTSCSHASSSILTFADGFIGIPPTIDSDESVKGSNQLSPLSNPNEVHWLNSLTSDGAHSILLDFTGDHFQTKAIPIGPRFQADVPDLAGPEDSIDSSNSKWLGTITWPIQPENKETSGKAVGKGRPESCSCASPGSVDCVTSHVLEERLALKLELGPAFFRWRFDDMGDEVSKAWSLQEQQNFELVVKVKSSANAKTFLKRALKRLFGKKVKDVVNYYFNVYIPNRMSMHMRSPSRVRRVDTDDEEEEEPEDCKYVVLQKKLRGSCGSKDSKGRYMR